MNPVKLAHALRKWAADNGVFSPSSPASPSISTPKVTSTVSTSPPKTEVNSSRPAFAAQPAGVATPSIVGTPDAGRRIPARPISTTAAGPTVVSEPGPDGKPPSTANIKSGAEAQAFLRQRLRGDGPSIPEAPSLTLPPPPKPPKAFTPKKPPSTKDFRMGATEGTT